MASCKPLANKICLVTGASRGIGKGIALQLGEAGATVYVTGRSLEKRTVEGVGGTLVETADEITARGGKGIPVKCDHSKDKDIESLFERIKKDNDGQLDILVNNAYSAVTTLTENIGKKFWETEPSVWDEVNNVGLRNHYICSVFAARLMVPRKSGLIVNVSSGGGLRYLFNVAYGVGKEALDRMAADMAIEIRNQGVTVVSLWPGAVQTELIMYGINNSNSRPTDMDESMVDAFKTGESIEFSGKAVVHLAQDPNVMKKSGKIVLTGELADEYGFYDVDGRRIYSMRCVRSLLALAGYKTLATWVPGWMKLPFTFLGMAGHKF